MSPEEYMESMDGEHFRKLLSEARTEVVVETSLPKFEAEYEADLGGILSDLGMSDAFDWQKADFRGMGAFPDKNIYISKVVHKTLALSRRSRSLPYKVSQNQPHSHLQYMCFPSYTYKKLFLFLPRHW